MKAIFERKLNFERKEIVSHIQIMQERPDIQKILKMDLDNLPNRLLSYLKKLELLDDYGQLTKEGEQAKKEGQILSEEYGQYEIWYIIDDPWFGTRPVALHRIRAGGDWQNDNQNNNPAWKDPGKQSKWTVNGHEVAYPLLDSDTGNLTWVYSLSVEAIRSTRTEQQQGILRFETDDIDAAILKCEISGKMRWSQKKKYDDKLNLVRYHNESVKDLLSEILGPEYDRERNVLIVNLAPTDIDELTSFVKNRFEKRDIRSERNGKFSRISIDDIPLRAANQSVAKEWILRLMQQSWACRYVSREQAELEQNEWLNSHALCDLGISSSSGKELLSVLGRESGLAYWNVAVMQDLIPSGTKSKVSFTLSKGERNVDHKIQRYLFEGREIRKIIISDGYVTPSSLQILKNMLPKNIPVQIYSFKHKLDDALPQNWTNNKLQKGDDNHDRIWLIYDGKVWDYWNFSTSVDHFTKNEGEIVMNKQMTITPIVKIPQYLQDIVDKQTNGGIL